MLKNSNLTEKDIGFFILLPAGAEVPDELLQNLNAVDKNEFIHIFKSDWLVYESAAEEDAYCWQIPGVKLYFKDEADFDKAKNIADRILMELREKTQLNLELVTIDKARLKETGTRTE